MSPALQLTWSFREGIASQICSGESLVARHLCVSGNFGDISKVQTNTGGEATFKTSDCPPIDETVHKGTKLFVWESCKTRVALWIPLCCYLILYSPTLTETTIYLLMGDKRLIMCTFSPQKFNILYSCMLCFIHYYYWMDCHAFLYRNFNYIFIICTFAVICSNYMFIIKR